MFQEQERGAPRKSYYYYNFPSEQSQTFPKIKSAKETQKLEPYQQNFEAVHDKINR